jgi:membrane-associated protease RseP (regulator of RpoE activity)
MTGALWTFAGLVIAIAIHEAGHALAGTVVAIPIRLLSVGVGPLLLQGRIGDMRWELRLLPFAGFVLSKPVAAIRKNHQALFILGGIMANMAFVCLVALLDVVGAVSKLPKFAHDGLGSLVVAQLYAIVVNLLPFRTSSGGTQLTSDGLQLLRLLQRPARRKRDGYPNA